MIIDRIYTLLVSGFISNQVKDSIEYSDTYTLPYTDNLTTSNIQTDNLQSKVIKPGASGPEVLELQKKLQQLGYDVPLNGTYDFNTMVAVINFKHKYNIHQGYTDTQTGDYVVNADVGKTTLDKMDQVIRNQNSSLNRVSSFIENFFSKFSSPIGDSINKISSYFGIRKDPFTKEKAYHTGIDIPAPMGMPIKAVKDGVVKVASVGNREGKYVILDHGNGLETIYCHASKLLVKNGQRVKRGEVIALVGSTGRSTGPHLHFGVKKDGKFVDPLKYFK